VQVCLAPAVHALRAADLEGEQLVLLSLLSVLTSNHRGNQRAVVYVGALPRVQEFVLHPEPQLQEHAVRAR
jgi:hypothetical protein